MYIKNTNIFVLFVIVLFCVACENKKLSTSKKNNLPNWIVKPLENCKDGFLCAVGEGSDILSASANARNELAKQFSVSVNSSTNMSINQNDDTSKTTFVYSISENANEVMSGVKIKETFTDINGDVYAFAVIDKTKIEKELLADINNIDNEIQTESNIFPLPVKKIKMLIKTRQEKNSKYLFLTGKQISTSFTLNDLRKMKKTANNYKLGIENDIIGLKTFLKNEIIDHFDKISEYATKTINGKVELEKQYLNVNGFEKYNVNIDLSCTENDKTIGSIKIRKSETGRNRQQVLDKAKEQIFEEISQKIDSLLM